MKTKSNNILLMAGVLLGLLLFAVPAYADKQAVIGFKETVWDFGQISLKGGKVSHKFSFTNTGDSNLIITAARADCGCTRPEYSDEPVAPGKSGDIKITYVPAGKGKFTKKVTVTTNGVPRKVRIIIKGEVIP